MAITLGIDTGGTYTDAVLIEDDATVLASAKSLTTRQDLAIGVGRAVEAVLASAKIAPEAVAMAALSTTLATNALVEGQGGRVALICAGFKDSDLDRQGLREALKGDPVLFAEGGHSHSGGEAKQLDREAVSAFIDSVSEQVTGFAIAGRFATRNPAHELEIAVLVRDATGLPTTCSHHLSSRLNGPKRAVTAVLNARLVGMIDALIGRAEQRLRDLGIDAPLMVVRGDGALMSTAQARTRPIETILSGPAASIVGARWLTGQTDALVSDIGGTTTDVALIRAGKPKIDPDGAFVGGFRTMVEAVAMRTTGLGGDSEVHLNTSGLSGGITLGPRRVLPVSLIAQEAPGEVREVLERQLNEPMPGEHDGRFVRATMGAMLSGLDTREQTLIDRIGADLHPLGAVLRNRVELGALGRLRDRGLIQIATITPSDAAHVLGLSDEWDADAAHMALALFSRRRVGSGNRVAPDVVHLAKMIIDQLRKQTVVTLLETGFDEDRAFTDDPSDLARHVLIEQGLQGHADILRLSAGLNLPVIGLGASAATYYPPVGEILNTRMILPTHAGVANAIGAVAGRVITRRSGTVTTPSEGRYRVHLPGGPEDFTALDAALTRVEAVLIEEARAAAAGAGAADIEVNVTRDLRSTVIETREMFVEGHVTVEASGRPRVAVD